MSKKVEYEIDGRKLIIIDEANCHADFFVLHQFAIRKFCQEREIARKFPLLIFTLVSGGRDAAYVLTEDLIKDRPVLQINVIQAPGVFEGYDSHMMGMLEHEVTHLYNNRLSRYYKAHAALVKRLKSKLAAYSNIEANLDSVRVILARFIRLIGSEGLAYFAQLQVEKTIDYGEQTLNAYYNRALASAKKWHLALLEFLIVERDFHKYNFLEYQKKFNDLLECTYVHASAIGFHVIHILSYENSLENLMHFRARRLIQKYEAFCLKQGVKPVITLSSGRGEIDHKSMLAEWAAVASHVVREQSS